MRNRKETGRAADVAVVGGGVVGLSLARELGRRGLSVVVVERGRPGAEASWAAGGMLAPQAEADADDDFFRLQCAARDLYPDLAGALRDETGVDIELDRAGTLYLALTEEDETELERRFAWQTRAGLAVERLTGAQARSLEPRVSEAVRLALRFPRDWQVENRRLVEALLRACETAGRGSVRVLAATEVRGVRVRDRRAEGLETSAGFVGAGAVVVAAGAWSSRLTYDDGGTNAGEFGRRVDEFGGPRVFPVRGQMLCFEQDGAEPIARHVVYTRRGYVVPRRGGRLLAGSTTEHAGFRKEVTAGGAREVLGHALEIAPSLGGLRLSDMWAGLRPATEDGRPVVGASTEVRGLFYSTGHYRNGILLAPLTGALLADRIADGARPALLEPFGPERFSREGVETLSR